MKLIRLGVLASALAWPCHAQITAGANTGTQGTGSSLTSSGITTSQNDLVIVACSSFGVTLGAPTDSKTGNTWTQCGGSPQATGSGSRIGVWWAVLSNASGFGSGHTFSCHPASSSDQGIAVQDFAGNAITPSDGGAGTTGTNTSPSPGNVVPSLSGDVLVGAQTHDSSPTTTRGGNFSASFIGDATSSAQPVALEYHIKTDAAAEAADWALSSSQSWAAIGCMFKKAAGAVSKPCTLALMGAGAC